MPDRKRTVLKTLISLLFKMPPMNFDEITNMRFCVPLLSQTKAFLISLQVIESDRGIPRACVFLKVDGDLIPLFTGWLSILVLE